MRVFPSGRVPADTLSPSTRMTDFNIQFVAQTDSTNTQLLQRAARHSIHRHVLVADVQTAGRGQRGRQWQASAGDAVLMSVAWEFERAQRLDGLSLAVGVAVRRGLAEHLGDRAKLKWPNDVLIVCIGIFLTKRKLFLPTINGWE